MNKTFFSHVTMYIWVLCFIFISCSGNLSDKNPDGKELLSFQSDSIEYVVNELDTKLDSQGKPQCDKFKEMNYTQDGFEIYGAHIADLFSFFFNVDEQNINFDSEKNSFYSIVYKGRVDEQIKRDIFHKLLDIKGLKIVENQILVAMSRLEIENSTKLDSYIHSNENDKISIESDGKKYIFSNVNFIIFTKKINEIYPNKFIYEGDSEKRYNLELPIGLEYSEMIDYLKKQYDISLIEIQKEILIYSFVEKSEPSTFYRLPSSL